MKCSVCGQSVTIVGNEIVRDCQHASSPVIVDVEAKIAASGKIK